MMVTGTLARKGFHAFDAETKTNTGLKASRTWVVVASRKEAFIYRKTADGLEPIAHAEAKGKQMESVDDHIFSPQAMNEHEHNNPQHEKSYHLDIVFVRRLAEWLDVAEKEKAFDGLVLVAAPATLGRLRACLTKNLQSHVRGEINKELTGMSAPEIQKHLEKNNII